VAFNNYLNTFILFHHTLILILLASV
jgi:hypothetical protein